jgi:hypothetical protein
MTKRSAIYSVTKATSLSSLVLIMAVTLFACAPFRPPVQNSGPVIARSGVELSVKRQSCTQSKEPEWPDADLVEEIVEVEIHSPVETSLAIQRDAFRLVAPDGAALRTVTWGAHEPISIGSGETRSFELRFMTRGSLDCAAPMTLESADAVRGAGMIRSLGAITFTPSTRT